MGITKEMGSAQYRYVFVSGKNWKLSLAELATFLYTKNCGFKIDSYSPSFFVITTEEALDPSIIEGLGGTIKIGISLLTIPINKIKAAFLRRNKQSREDIKELLSSSRITEAVFSYPLGTPTFGISVYVDDWRFERASGEIHRFFGSYFKKMLASRGEKSSFMGFPKYRAQPQLTHVEVLKRELLEKSGEVVFCLDKKQALISKTIAVHNPFDFQKRDIERPFQRKMFSIPPRLARIMVNLSRCRKGSVFLDPFCGVGTVLQEAMLTGAEVIGVDLNPWCIKASRSNLEWLTREYSLKDVNYDVLVGDSRRLRDQIHEDSVECIATEPDLGPPLRHFPTKSYAEKIIDTLRPVYNDFLMEAYETLKEGGRLVLVTPYIKNRDGAFISLNVMEKARSVGFKIVSPFEKSNFVNEISLSENLAKEAALVDMGERHKVGREIHIFQK